MLNIHYVCLIRENRDKTAFKRLDTGKKLLEIMKDKIRFKHYRNILDAHGYALQYEYENGVNQFLISCK